MVPLSTLSTFSCGDNVMFCTSQFQNRPSPPPRAIPGHLTRVKLRTVGNLTQNEARPVGHLTFVSKRLSAVGNKRISQFFDSARAPRSRVIALVDSTWVFLLLSFLHLLLFITRKYAIICVKWRPIVLDTFIHFGSSYPF